MCWARTSWCYVDPKRLDFLLWSRASYLPSSTQLYFHLIDSFSVNKTYPRWAFPATFHNTHACCLVLDRVWLWKIEDGRSHRDDCVSLSPTRTLPGLTNRSWLVGLSKSLILVWRALRSRATPCLFLSPTLCTLSFCTFHLEERFLVKLFGGIADHRLLLSFASLFNHVRCPRYSHPRLRLKAIPVFFNHAATHGPPTPEWWASRGLLLIVFHVLHLLTCHFGPAGLFFSIFARATLHVDAAELALGARSPLNCLRATVDVQCGRRFFMPCFNSLRERICPLAAQVKSPDLVDFPPWKAFTSAFSVFTSLSLFALTTTGKNSTSPAGVSPPELEVMLVQQCAYNLSLEFEPMNHMSCTTCTLTLCHCLTNLLDIQPLRLPLVPSEPGCAAMEVARPQGLRAPLRQFDVPNLQTSDSSVHRENTISFDCDSDPSRPEEIASVGYPRSWLTFMMLLQFMVLRKRKRSPILSLWERLARAWLPASSMQFSHPWRGTEKAHWKRELVLPVAACKISLHDQPELRTFTCTHTTGDTHQVWRLHGPICCHQCQTELRQHVSEHRWKVRVLHLIGKFKSGDERHKLARERELAPKFTSPITVQNLHEWQCCPRQGHLHVKHDQQNGQSFFLWGMQDVGCSSVPGKSTCFTQLIRSPVGILSRNWIQRSATLWLAQMQLTSLCSRPGPTICCRSRQTCTGSCTKLTSLLFVPSSARAEQSTSCQQHRAMASARRQDQCAPQHSHTPCLPKVPPERCNNGNVRLVSSWVPVPFLRLLWMPIALTAHHSSPLNVLWLVKAPGFAVTSCIVPCSMLAAPPCHLHARCTAWYAHRSTTSYLRAIYHVLVTDHKVKHPNSALQNVTEGLVVWSNKSYSHNLDILTKTQCPFPAANTYSPFWSSVRTSKHMSYAAWRSVHPLQWTNLCFSVSEQSQILHFFWSTHANLYKFSLVIAPFMAQCLMNNVSWCPPVIALSPQACSDRLPSSCVISSICFSILRISFAV